jgi:hypothetical protein
MISKKRVLLLLGLFPLVIAIFLAIEQQWPGTWRKLTTGSIVDRKIRNVDGVKEFRLYVKYQDETSTPQLFKAIVPQEIYEQYNFFSTVEVAFVMGKPDSGRIIYPAFPLEIILLCLISMVWWVAVLLIDQHLSLTAAAPEQIE